MIAVRVCFCLLISLFYITANAQDPHFTQYFASPLTLNPALTGFFDGDYRVAVNERTQWWNVGASYNTTSISADMKILRDEIPTYDTFGIGVSGIFDKSLNNALKSNYISLSSAYHKNLANAGEQVLTLGVQFTYANRYIDYNSLTFASQFNSTYFDTTLPPSSIDYNYSNTNYFEANAGLLYAFHSEKANIYAGVSVYHINQPKELLFDPSGFTVKMRSTIHSGGEYFFNDQSSVLYSGVYAVQGKVNDQLFGLAYAVKPITTYNETNKVKLYFGLWYRVRQSLIPYLGIDYLNFSVGANYGVASYGVKSYQPRTFEVSLIYKLRRKYSMMERCPVF